MSTGTTAPLVGVTAKEKAEAANFDAFRLAHPAFAGWPLLNIQRGGEPPDLLCLDAQGKRVGVELVQWINERQMAESKARYKLEESYRHVIRSTYVQPPKNIGMIFISAKDKTPLEPANATAFHHELYKFLSEVDAAWLSNPEWTDPPGLRVHGLHQIPVPGAAP
jgi:hypothetical protein